MFLIINCIRESYVKDRLDELNTIQPFDFQGRYPVASIRDTIRLRFKTNSENGVILYSRGSQGDYIALQLVENRLLLNINLGHVPGKSPMELETSMALGSLLDDNIFHEVLNNV